MPTDHAYTYVSEEDIEALLSVHGKTASLDDLGVGAPTGDNDAHLNKAIQWATARVNFYLGNQYAARYLAESWIVNDWATILACYWLRTRRGNPAPSAIMDMYKGAVEDMSRVQSGEVNLPDTPTRSAAWPAWSNVRVDQLYPVRKVRVERGLSESRGGRPSYQQHLDFAAEYVPFPY